ncbi:TnsA endonuclease N-terminal domain-containing protein [Alicyclobacillus curvatus]|nr:TnsA endonuclease N-terminal domain-containing protein [Alicyclobacillus curvatus]
MPVRKIEPSKKYAFRGKEPTTKNDGIIHWESLLELDLVKLIEFDTRVVHFEHQPLRLNYEYRGKLREYTPDFKVVLNDGTTVMVEVKPEKFLKDPATQVKLEVGFRHCQHMGWTHKVITERQLHVGFLQSNLDLLLDVRGYDLEQTIANQIINRLTEGDVCTVSKLYNSLKLIPEELFYLHLYLLIYRQAIYADLINEELISSDFRVRLVKPEDRAQWDWL